MRLVSVSFRVVLLLAGIGLFAFRLADEPFTDRLLRQLALFAQQRPYEKVYVQTDRDRYVVGETVWLTGYLRDGQTHTADTLSQILYVELVDVARRRVVVRAALRATDAVAAGRLPLPDSLAAGPYQLRAYTNFMRNAGEAFFFRKTLTVYRTDKSDAANVSPETVKPDVQFLPEGGQLVNGLLNRMSIKAVGADGHGLDVMGFVLDQQNDTIVGFATQHLGMGTVDFTPEANSQYRAFVRQPTGEVLPYPWPTAQARGYGLTVDALSNVTTVRVFVGSTMPDTTSGKLTLVAQCRHAPVFVGQLPANRKNVLLQIPRANLPEGIVQFTLFSPTGQPLAERLAYSSKNQVLHIQAQPNKKAYKPRELVNLDLTVTDGAGQPIAANLSVAVTDAGQVGGADTTQADALTLPAYLLLTSDLTGLIENPTAYFDPNQPSRGQYLDLLLRTQGWRRFAWPSLLTNTLSIPEFVAENKGLSLTGQVLRAGSKKPAGKVNLTFMVTRRDSSRNVLTGESDDTGRFGAYDLDFTDTTNVLIQAIRNRADRELTINVDQLTNPMLTIVQVPYNPLSFDRQALAAFLKNTADYRAIEEQIRRNKEVLLKEVVVKAKREVTRDSRKIYSEADATVKFDQTNTASAFSFFDVIRGRVAGLQVTGTGLNMTAQIRGATNFGGVVEPLYVLDGTPTSKDNVISLPVQDIEQVDILKGASASIYGSSAAGGVIVILTKRGSPNYDPTTDKTPGILFTKLPGLQPVRQFYAPRYDAAKPEHTRPDYRATLHWQPTLKTGADGKARLSFWTSDARTRLRIVAEGISTDGQPGTVTGVVAVE